MKSDVIVVGAGIIGLAAAARLLAQGAEVTLLERNLIGHESSWAGGGILSPLHPWNYADEVTRLTDYSALLFPSWTADLHDKSGIDPEYEKSGLLMLPPYDAVAARRWCSKRNIEIEQRSIPDDLFEDNAERTGQALFFPGIAQVRNPRLLRALSIHVTQLGGRIVEHCTVTGLKIVHRQVQSIASTGGDFSAGDYVVSAGAWSNSILGSHAANLDIKPVKGQMLLFKYDSPPIRTMLVQNDLYLIPRRDGYLLAGSTLEDAGFDKRPTRSAHDHLLTHACAILPSLGNKSVIRHWTGLRPASPNNIPTIGRHPEVRNLFINSGHFRYGVTMAPASAEILVNEMTGIPQPFDVSPYRMR